MRKIYIWILALAFAANICAEEKSLRLENLTCLALERNPRIKSYQDLARAQKSRAASESALPDPVLSFSLKNIGLDRWTVGEEMMSGLGLALTQMIPFPGKLRIRAEIASQRALQLEESFQAVKLSVVREVKELYAKLFYYQMSITLLEKKIEILKNILKLAETKYSVGKAAQSDILKAHVEISGMEEMLLTMKGMTQAARSSLNSLLDFPPDNPLGDPEAISFSSLDFTLPELLDAATSRSPLLKEAGYMVAESATEVKMAEREFYPNFMIQAGKDFKGPFPDMYEVMVGVEIPLFYKKKQANLLEEARSRLSSSKNQYTSMKNEVHSMLSENYVMAKTAESLMKLYKERIIPQANLALESSFAGYAVDKVDFLMLLSDVNSLISFEIEYYKNLTSLWASAAKIEELTSLELIR